jgi:phage tail sheath protein FI
MPVTTSYPGVYIEEIPSGVRTLTGVATSITAFVGYTARGPVNRALRLFSFADFEREFGGLALDSPLSYCINHFFQNGGTEAYVIRVAENAAAASVTLGTAGAASAPTLTVAAISEGTWGNSLQIDVDYATSNPASLFNFGVTEFIVQNGVRVPGRSEVFRNLSMDSLSTNYSVALINASSALVRVTRIAVPPPAAPAGGTSVSGELGPAIPAIPLGVPGYRFRYTLNGQGPFDGHVPNTVAPAGPLAAALGTIGAQIAAVINAQFPGAVTASVAGNTISFNANTSGTAPREQSSIHFLDASVDNVCQILRLGQANGGVETDGAAYARPAQNGTLGTIATGLPPVLAAATLTVAVNDAAGLVATSAALPVWGGAIPQPATLAELVGQINAALTAGTTATPQLAGASAQVIDRNSIRIVPGTANPNHSFVLTGPLAGPFAFAAAGARNVARYAPGVGVTQLAQTAGPPGANGTPPATAGIITGSQALKTGMFALEDVDLFNLLVIPEATGGPVMLPALTAAIAYCVRRRAFMIIDAPDGVTNRAQAEAWISGTTAPRSRNVAIYFPRMRERDPLMPGVVRTSHVAGAMAGIYARTDAERGVWKAPAGISAVVNGATGLAYTLTDLENGTLNPLGLNCLRTFPVIGTVSWGARTGNGADALADEYKYVPVRRLALFLEESLYRGTQWAVFEPNDEPLWAQIRLNLGAFMHTLFSQGAFQGRTPRDAYFVKCDKETTTQNDINLGRVNIVVGFAPLKPAEFVVIQIQQIAGAIQT